jgi:hypothetical protein
MRLDTGYRTHNANMGGEWLYFSLREDRDDDIVLLATREPDWLTCNNHLYNAVHVLIDLEDVIDGEGFGDV